MLKSLTEAKNRTTQPSCLWQWTKRNTNKVFLCFLSVPCTSWAAQRPHSHLCASGESVVHLAPFFLPSLFATFHFSIHPLGSFPPHDPTTKFQHRFLPAKDFQKLLGVHVYTHCPELYSGFLMSPSNAGPPSFTGGLLAGHGVCQSEHWAHSYL